MPATEVAFFSGEEAIRIVPRVRLDSLKFICGDLPELKPSIPAVVPMWVAIFLRKRDKCRIVTPAWMETDALVATLEAERRTPDRFAPLPYHYVEISKDLLQHAAEDLTDVHRIRSLLSDIMDHRRAKVERGLQNMDADTTFILMNDISAMELNRI